MNEMKIRDVSEIKQPEAQGFREIKPETNMSVSDARSFVDNEFASMDSKEHQQQKTYYDDNGKKYREGDSLLPNKTFEVNGYRYKTDDHGRPISAEGHLRLRDPEYKRDMDSMEAVGKGDQQENDHRGHLIAHQFEGSGGIENLVAMEGKLNQGDYAKLENTLADALKDGADVKLKVEPKYKGDSNRPDEFRVSYSIDGDKDVVVFKNRSDGNVE